MAALAATLWLLLAACGGSTDDDATGDDADRSPSTTADAGTTTASTTATTAPSTPGGYEFDRSDPEGGISNIMEAFATDRDTAVCIYDAWGDVANVPPQELTPELMMFPICGTSIFQLMTGDARFTGADDG